MRRTLLTCALLAVATTALPARADELSDVFDRVSASVVVIQTQEKDFTPWSQGQPVDVGGLGSGVLIAEDLIMTAAHVVQTAEMIAVQFPSEEIIGARVVASNPPADVALLRLERAPRGQRVIAAVGNSDDVRVAEQVFIVGAPLGISHTLTVGHISARREVSLMAGGMRPTEFFQTDAAINQGNSGGPMFNMKGEVIGIVSHIISQTGGYEGLGFAVTSNVAKELLLEKKTLWSGLEGYYLTREWATIFNVPPPGVGMLVQRVAAGSPAEEAGLRGGVTPATVGEEEIVVGGDIILEVLGVSIADKDAGERIQQLMSLMNPGQNISIIVLREGQKLELQMPKPGP